MFKVIHIKQMDRTNPQHVYCGRPSLLGNPYPMKGESSRDDVCNAYAIHFNTLLINDAAFRKEVERVRRLHDAGDVSLVCFCAPRRCHCETLANYLNEEL